MERLTVHVGNEILVECGDKIDITEKGIIELLKTKLAAYEDAEEQGRLIVLPCEVGDELWFEKNGQLRCETIDRIKFDQTDEDEEPFCSIYTMSVSILFEDIGRLVWLSREKAEKALEGMNNG